MDVIKLSDRQCRLFLRDMREFGYPDLTFKEVRELADKVANGEDVSYDVIGIALKQQINEAMEGRR